MKMPFSGCRGCQRRKERLVQWLEKVRGKAPQAYQDVRDKKTDNRKEKNV